MGFFDLFKKKKPSDDKKESSFVVDAGNGKSVKVTFSGIQSAPAEHETWPKINGNSEHEYANAVFLSIHKGKPHKMDSVAHLAWLSYKLGIHDPVRKYKDMLSEGYFREARPDEILNTYRVAEIKGMLTAHDVEAAGKKADLIAALLEAVPVKKLNLPALYRLSSKGWDYMEQHQDLITLFNNPYNITYEEYIGAKKEAHLAMKYNDIVWLVFNRREAEFTAKDTLAHRYNTEYRAQFLKSEKRFSAALKEYITVIYYLIDSTTESYMILSNANRTRKQEEKTPLPELCLSDYFANAVYELREYYNRDMVADSIRHALIRSKHISDADFHSFVDGFFANKEADFSKYVKK